VVAINWRTKDILLGECKWGTDEVGWSVIRALVDKTGKVLPDKGWTVHYVFFARRGFTDAARAEAAALNGIRPANAMLVTLEQLEADIHRWMKGRRGNQKRSGA